MRRREFISLLGGAAAAWPRSARAQQPAMPVIGFLNPASPEPIANRLREFHRGLKETGFVEGENVTIVYRWAENRLDRLPELAADLVRRQVAVIAATNTPSAPAAKAATATIPVVFAVSDDPVKLGLVTSLSRPGGNLTGINFLNSEVGAKRLGLLRELVPTAARIAVLVNPTDSNNEASYRTVEAAAIPAGLHLRRIDVSTSREIDAAFATISRERPDALFVGGNALFTSRRVQLVNLASRHALPATFHSREMTEVGGLMSYGTSIADAFRQVGVYTGLILKGARPAELSCRRASSSWSSTCRPPGCSASRFHRRCSSSPTRCWTNAGSARQLRAKGATRRPVSILFA